MSITATVDGDSVTLPEGSSILDACRAAHRTVNTLCYHPRLSIVGSCRVCLVEVEQGGKGKLVPACATPLGDGTVIRTRSERARSAAANAVTMELHDHPWVCMTCEASGDCRLQNLARKLRVEPEEGHASGSHGPRSTRHDWDDDSSNALRREPSKCISCTRCVRACSELQGMHILGMHGRGASAVPMPAFDLPLSATACIQCGQCAAVCPTGAIIEKPVWRSVLEDLSGPRDGKIHVAQTAPATRIGIAEEMGFSPGDSHATTGRLAASLRALGFDYVFDTQFTADLTILEEASELLNRLNITPKHVIGDGIPSPTQLPGPLPMATSCCPGWVNFVERVEPQWIPHLSSARSPQGMMSSIVKHVFATRIGVHPDDIVITSVMPCTAKKDEAQRPQLTGDTDRVVTTRELGKMLRASDIRYASLEEDEMDNPLGESTGAGTIFGVSGGVAEAALRTAWWLITGESLPSVDIHDARGIEGGRVKLVRLPLGDKHIAVAVTHGMHTVRDFLHLLDLASNDEPLPPDLLPELHPFLKEVVFFEVMACPSGCIGGGGQPKSDRPDVLEKRAAAIYTLDERAVIRESHKNQAVLDLYTDVLGHPLSPTSHKLLHTTYTDRTDQVLDQGYGAAQVEAMVSESLRNK